MHAGRHQADSITMQHLQCKSVRITPTCYTAECLASRGDQGEISQSAHLDNLKHSTGGNDHSITVRRANICYMSRTYIGTNHMGAPMGLSTRREG